MPTQIIKLNKAPVRVTNGSQSAFIQSESNREFGFAHSETSPDITSGAHSAKEVFVTSPFIIWVWSKADEPMNVIVSAVQE